MLFDPARHEPLTAPPWDASRAREAIGRIVQDAEARFSPQEFWPPHPNDVEPGERQPLTPLYFGGIGMVWALHHLQGLGAVPLTRDYLPYLASLAAANERWLGEQYAAEKASFHMGDTPHLMMAYSRDPKDEALRESLRALIEGNTDHPSRELMWGAPGTALAAWFLYQRTGDARWSQAFLASAAHLWSQLKWSEQFQCRYWTQDLYGRESTYLDAVHGFVATAGVIIRGRALLSPAQWQAWQETIVSTIERTATCEGAYVNWRAWLIDPPGQPPRFLMQFCHGAPGFVICLADLPSAELDPLLLAAGEVTWAAGPLTKGSNLCHGTGGNGYAFLKLYQRTGDELWLARARDFAMHGMAQTEADMRRFGQGRYSLWTGDIGFALYLWDCLNGTASFPTFDVF